jgi:DNA-binding LacI/PurR family transcriptional regulator
VESPRRATLKDVSSQAGVSLYTASRALSDHAGVAKRTQARVREVAARLGYVANQHARSLKGGASSVIGVIAASKANQYYATLVGALEDAVEANGYSCFVADAAANGVYLPAREDRIIESMIQQRVAAVVVTYAIDDRNLALLDSWRIPVLFVDCLPPDASGSFPSVATDNFSASLAMGNHLASLGYRRWCFVGHARNWNTREPRQRGFEAAAANCGATIEIVEGGNDAGIARRGVIAMLTRLPALERPHAVYASNTVLLKGVLLALRDCGIEIPRQMAVAAFDDFDWAAILHPPMTVIDQHIALIGRTAGSQLLSLLGGTATQTDALRKATIAATLKVRESCGAGLAPKDRPGAGEAQRPGERARKQRQ